ncbi:unnamed protein product [Closterium sp. Naga37s-1]|nr:unnamed protein product [Closterium sp. Naga37s-1]
MRRAVVLPQDVGAAVAQAAVGLNPPVAQPCDGRLPAAAQASAACRAAASHASAGVHYDVPHLALACTAMSLTQRWRALRCRSPSAAVHCDVAHPALPCTESRAPSAAVHCDVAHPAQGCPPQSPRPASPCSAHPPLSAHDFPRLQRISGRRSQCVRGGAAAVVSAAICDFEQGGDVFYFPFSTRLPFPLMRPLFPASSPSPSSPPFICAHLRKRFAKPQLPSSCDMP